MRRIDIISNVTGKAFTTIFSEAQLHDPELPFRPDEDCEIFLQGKNLGVAVILAVRKFSYSQIHDAFSYVNSGRHTAHQAALLVKHYELPRLVDPNTVFSLVVLKWKARNLEVFQFHLQEWWSNTIEQDPNNSKSNINGSI